MFNKFENIFRYGAIKVISESGEEMPVVDAGKNTNLVQPNRYSLSDGTELRVFVTGHVEAGNCGPHAHIDYQLFKDEMPWDERVQKQIVNGEQLKGRNFTIVHEVK